MGALDHGLIEDVLRLFEAEGLEELVVEEPGLRIAVRRETETPPPPARGHSLPERLPHGKQPSPVEEAGLEPIAAPVAGVFYRAPSPGSRAYVSEGEEVEVGQVVGIVEAMKVMNEITSHVAGTIRRIVVKSEELVAVGQVLMWVEPH
jgi:acetyl-CoA carboxylase biotin carboxyl carrier protein